jgi:hypothetical protein
MRENKTAAMEMTVGTIVTIVLLMAALILGLVLTTNIFKKTSESVNIVDEKLKGELKNLFVEDTKLIVGLGGDNTVRVLQGTDNFGIPIAFAPDLPAAWGTSKQGCKYSLTINTQGDYCVKNGWTNVANSIVTGSSNIVFDQVDATNGYALIKINVPETVPKCLQRFNIKVNCTGYPAETTTSFFDMEVLKKGLLSK